MTVTTTATHAVSLSDLELLEAVRVGDDGAFAQLWMRHAPSGRRAARAITTTFDPDDVVSEAFTSILGVVRRGGGPSDAFRPYLFQVIRNVAASWGRGAREITTETIDVWRDDTPVDPTEDADDRSLLIRAFRDLPDRWRSVLWYVEVEGMKPREIAPLIGMSPNAVSALIYRAREGFRDAWLRAHVGDAARSEECRWACLCVARRQRGRVSRADRERLEAHLAGCAGCRLFATDLDDVSSKLRLVLLPVVLGGGAAASYAAQTPAAMAASGGWIRSGRLPRGASIGAAAGVAVAASLVIAGAVAGVAERWTIAKPVESVAPPASPSEVVDPADDTPGKVPLDTPPLGDDLLRASPPASPRVFPRAAETVSPSPPDAASVIEPAVSTPTPHPNPNPRPTPTPTPTPTPPGDRRSATPTLLAPAELDAPIPEALAGTGVAGATIGLVRDDGAVVATSIVGDDGRWQAVIPGDELHQGMTVRAEQNEPGRETSEPTDAVGPFTFPVAMISIPGGSSSATYRDGDGDGDVDDVTILLSGIPGRTVSVSIDGVSTGNRHLLQNQALERVILDARPGTRSLGIRYVDPASGRAGPEARYEVIVPPRP